MGLTLATPPDAEPVTVAEAKTHLGVTTSSYDTYIGDLIKSATRYVERYTGLSLMTRSWLLTLDEFSDTIELPRGPVTEITSVQYVDADGDTQTLDPSYYTLDDQSVPQWLVRNSDYSWPTTLDAVNVVSITYVAGYDELPDEYTDVKLAIQLLVGHYFQNREASVPVNIGELPLGVESLCGPFRLPTLA